MHPTDHLSAKHLRHNFEQALLAFDQHQHPCSFLSSPPDNISPNSAFTFEHLLLLNQRSCTLFFTLILCALCMLPIPGLGTIFSFSLVLLALSFLLGRSVTLPTKVTQLSFTPKHTRSILTFFFYLWHVCARFCAPRLMFMSHPVTRPLWFVIWLVMTFIIFLPIPFGNILPGLTLIVFCFGWLQRDGLLLMLTLPLSVLSAITLWGSFHLVYQTIEYLMSWLPALGI